MAPLLPCVWTPPEIPIDEMSPHSADHVRAFFAQWPDATPAKLRSLTMPNPSEMEREGPKLADALEALERWCRKYRQFTVHGGPFYDDCDGVWVELKDRGGRKVVVDQNDLAAWADGDRGPQPTIAEIILEAIRLWDV